MGRQGSSEDPCGAQPSGPARDGALAGPTRRRAAHRPAFSSRPEAAGGAGKLMSIGANEGSSPDDQRGPTDGVPGTVYPLRGGTIRCATGRAALPSRHRSLRLGAPPRIVAGGRKEKSHSRAGRSVRVAGSIGMSSKTHAIHVVMGIAGVSKMIPGPRTGRRRGAFPGGLRTKFAGFVLPVSYPDFSLTSAYVLVRPCFRACKGTDCETHPCTRLYAKGASSPRVVRSFRSRPAPRRPLPGACALPSLGGPSPGRFSSTSDIQRSDQTWLTKTYANLPPTTRP